MVLPMSRLIVCGSFVGLLVAAIAVEHPARAGGIFLYEQGTREVGLAAAGWAARAGDAATLFTNPAGMSRLHDQQLMVSGQLFYGDFGFHPNENTTVQGNDGGNPVGLFASGSIFYVHEFSPKWSAGVGLFSYFGLSSDYEQGWVGRYYVMESTLIGVTLMPAVSYRLNDQFSFGAGLNVMFGFFDKSMAINNVFQPTDGTFKISDNTPGVGVNLGVLWEINDGRRFGFSYLSPVKLDFKDTPEITGLGSLMQGALQRAGIVGQELDLGMTVPQSLMVSGYEQLNDEWAVMGNVGWQNWDAFGKVDVVVGDTLASITADRNYKDTWHAALGAEWGVAPRWLVSGGIAYDSSPVSDADRTLDTPMGAVWRFGLGGLWTARQSVEIGFAYELVYIEKLPVDQFRGPLAGRVAGEFDDVAYVFAANVQWHF